MKKRFLAGLLAAMMVSMMGTTAFAAGLGTEEVEAKIEVIALSEDISEATLNEISNSVYAGIVYPDGTTVPIDSVLTVEKLPSTLRSQVDSYAVTLSSKIVSDSADKNTSHTNASATLKLKWTDGPYLNNSIDEVSGTLDVEKGKVTSGEVRYGDGWTSALRWICKDVGSKSSFTYYPNLTAADPTADYSIGFENEIVTLSLTVSANILQ